uniref:C2H2-type domain-containing protein n=1 Tax=Gouania willdenowi TaxID=441366 RepID=A0A8C5G0C3_GOUWI
MFLFLSSQNHPLIISRVPTATSPSLTWTSCRNTSTAAQTETSPSPQSSRVPRVAAPSALRSTSGSTYGSSTRPRPLVGSTPAPPVLAASTGWRAAHEDSHGEREYKCTVCGKAFQRAQHLKCHLTTHSGTKEYSCPQCGKEFGFKSSRDHHVKTHSSEKPFHCSVCGKKFNTQRSLRVHTKLHSKEKAHQCGDCGLKISDFSALKIHLRSHTGERPYHCTNILNDYNCCVFL